VVVITGDAIETPDGLPLLDRFLQLLDPSTPKVATVGNWEMGGHVDPEALGRIYARHNGRLLRNASARLVVHEAPLLFTGLDDEVTGRPDVRTALADATPAANHLLLAHCPATRERLPTAWATAPIGRDAEPRRRGRDAELAAFTPVAMLAGHTHGGQVAPFGLALWRPPGSGRYLRGWYEDDGALPLYVSVGIGTTVLPARLGAVPEVALFDWEVG
jgi:predicted MPP superfamily phosphohydrolase